jgi:hypothetical protein
LHEFLNPCNRAANEAAEARHVELYERRAEIGGVWFFEKDNDIAKGWPSSAGKTSSGSKVEQEGMPHLNGDYASTVTDAKHSGAMYTQADALKDSLPRAAKSTPSVSRWVSPAYHGLVGNVLPPLLEFSALPIEKPSLGLFPSMTETHQYLLDFAKPLRSHIKTRREVKNVEPVFVDGMIQEPVKWKVTSLDWSIGEEEKESIEEWDAIVVAPGINEHPYYPEGISGLEDLLEARSPTIMHAKTYSGPLPFVNQHNKIAVIGNGNSANDICAHLAPLNSEGPLYRCARHEGKFAHLKDERIVDVASVSAFELSEDKKTVSLRLTDGKVLSGMTKVIFATGYQFEFPWIKVPRHTAGTSLTLAKVSPADLKPASLYGAVPDLHEQMFLAIAPTLCFVGLPTCAIPLPLSEVMARIVSRVYHNVLSLPADDVDGLLTVYRSKCKELGLRDNDSKGWRALHMLRGADERKLTKYLIEWLERGQPGGSQGLFRWDDRREEIAKGMRAVKEGELKRLRDLRIAAGGVDGGVGGVLAVGYEIS